MEHWVKDEEIFGPIQLSLEAYNGHGMAFDG